MITKELNFYNKLKRMPVLDNVKSVAKYESKLLMRSWFYRVFLILAILFLCVFNFTALINSNGGFWIMKALPSNIPYINLLFLNTGQAIIAVFLSSEFLKADKKLDTSEVFYVHPLSNAEYVVGKIWGNMNVFIRLNLLIIAIVAIFNLASGITIDWLAYITYFFIISIPTLIYIFGLSVALMLILKNQAITFVILLGYIGITVFYLEAKFYYLFDYMVYNLPLVKSTVVGFSNWGALINHRCIYLAFGLGFLCISIYLFRRLPNTKYGRYKWLALAIGFFITGGASSFIHVNSILKKSKMRTLYTDINNKYVNTAKMVIENYNIMVEQRPETIFSEVEMNGVALENASNFTFCLNPGLYIREINEQGKELSFKRESQIILVDFGREITQGESVSFTMKYDGRIDEGFCYLDIPPEILQQEYASEMFKIDKKYSFQTKNYILFTPETYWYPRPGTSYSSDNPDWQQAYFSNFQLTVKTLDGLQALSQGTLVFPEERSIVPSKLPTKKKGLSDKIQERTGQNQGRGPGGAPGGQFRNIGGGGPGGPGGPGGGGQGGQGRNAGGGGPGGGGQGRNFQGGGQGGQGGGGMQRGGPQDSARMQAMQRRFQEEGGMQRGGPQDSARMQAMQRRFQEEGGMQRGGPQDSARMQAMQRRFQEEGGMQRGGPQDSARMQDRRRFQNREDNFTLPDSTLIADNNTIKVIPKDSLFIFKTDFPTPSITLIIGDYEQKKIEVDNTEFSVWHLRDHNHFYPVFEGITDTIPGLIRERRQVIEYQYSLDYSYNRFSIVEVPVQFNSYARTWSQAQEKMQPEMILYPEKGCLFNEADFASSVKNQKFMANRNGMDISDEEAAMRSLRFFMATFQRAESNINISNDRGEMNITFNSNPYFIFPQLYNFRYNIFSSEWPISNRLIEVYLQNRSDDDARMRQTNGISNNEKANLLIEKRPFKELLADTEHRSLLDNIVALKANTLFAPAERNIGNREFRDSLRFVLQRNIFTNIRFENLLDTLGMITGVDLIQPLETWNNPLTLPVYLVGVPDVARITNRDIEVFVVKLQITNNSDVDGIINVQINSGTGGAFFGNAPNMGGGGRGMQIGANTGGSVIYDPRTDRKLSFTPHETKLLVSVWEEAPRNIRVNTLISANLPSIINLPISNIVRERNIPIMAEGDYIIENFSNNIPGEVIVDNEDPYLFDLSKPDIVGLLPKWLDDVGDNSFPYSGVSAWRPPLQWTLTTNDKYYGTHVRSAYVIKNGNGSQTATWKIPVPSAGAYNLFYHLTKTDDGRRGGFGQQNSGGNRNANNAEYQFKIKYDDGEESAYLNFRRSVDGWNSLGTYFFSEDTVRVTLNNNSKSRLIVADAVKIVKRQY